MAETTRINDEKRLIVAVVDDLAKNDPEKLYASIPRLTSDGQVADYEDITYRRFANAINRMSWWLEKTLGKPETPFQTLAYFGPNDVRYWIMVLAGIKTSYKFFLSNPRNSTTAQAFLFEKTNCNTILYGSSVHDLVDNLVSSVPDRRMQSFVIPDLDDVLDSKLVEIYPYTRTFDEARYDPLVVLHTSGTTGMPKPIQIPQSYSRFVDLLKHFPDIDGRPLFAKHGYKPGMRILSILPAYHAAGIFDICLRPILVGVIVAFFPPDLPIHQDLIYTCLIKSRAAGTGLAPSLLIPMLSDPEHRKALAQLDRVTFGAGPLPDSVGNDLLRIAKLAFNAYGSTEMEVLPTVMLENSSTDWRYFHFHPWSGVHMEYLEGSEDLHELVIRRVDDMGLTGLQPCFEVFREDQEYHTKDLFQQHPTKPHLWRFMGRNDDVVVLSNGEMFNPVTAESTIGSGHNEIQEALVVGHGRFNPGLLVELKDKVPESKEDREALLTRIWPVVEKGNSHLQAYAQIPRDLITLTGPEKPFSRTPKGSVQRRITVELFKDEIEDMFLKFEEEGEAAVDSDGHQQETSEETIREFLERTICEQLRKNEAPQPNDDLFRSGMDSLIVLRLVRSLNSAFRATGRRIDSRLIYANPTLSSLATALHIAFNNSTQANISLSSEPNEQRAARLNAVLERFTKNLPTQGSIEPSPYTNGTNSGNIVLLTGSTGTLGTYILALLLANPAITKVYCLNRSDPTSAASRQLQSFTSAGLDTTDLTFAHRVTYIQTTNPGALHLGLDTSTYADISASITHIIHNAWPVDFNLNLDSFTDVHIAGVRRIVDLAAGTIHHASLAFISSIASVSHYPALHDNSGCPEEIITNPLVAEYGGYGESKYIAERILDAATEASAGKLHTTVFRVGQIAGPVKHGAKGVWNTKEWFPRMIRSSATVGAVPRDIGAVGEIDWLPVDSVARALVELTLSDGRGNDAGSATKTSVYHIVNPSVVDWECDLLPTVLEHLPHGSKAIKLSAWLEKVQDAAGLENNNQETPKTNGTTLKATIDAATKEEGTATADINNNPALQLLPFFESLAASTSSSSTTSQKSDSRLQTRRTETAWPGLKEVGPVRGEWVNMWMNGWGFE